MVKYAGDKGDDEEARRRFEEARQRLQRNTFHTCDTCHIQYPAPLMKTTAPPKLCKACDIQRQIKDIQKNAQNP